MNRTFILIMLGGTFFSAISQILLKQSANIKYDNPLREYLNWRVILAYVMFFGILLLNTWCYTKVDMRYGACDRYCRLCIRVIAFSFHPERKDHKGETDR